MEVGLLDNTTTATWSLVGIAYRIRLKWKFPHSQWIKSGKVVKNADGFLMVIDYKADKNEKT